MIFTKIRLENWRNFRLVEVPLQRRVFLVGPNASGKSNFLDAFRFLKDIALPEGGGLQKAVKSRGGVSALRSLHARKRANVAIEVEVKNGSEGLWGYRIEFSQDSQKRPVVKSEVVKRDGEAIRTRPGEEDKGDDRLLSETHLEQVSLNRTFRELADAFAKISYRHIVPQLVREPERSVGRVGDPFGGDFLEQLAVLQREKKRTFDSRLRRINDALKVAVPQLEKLELQRDVKGTPHLKGLYAHWRPNAGWQTEGQFSDGTLRLLGLLWSLMDGKSPLMLEEPELSLHAGVVRYLPGMIYRITRKSGRQVVTSTHSQELLSDKSISGEQVLMLCPTKEDTVVQLASTDEQVKALMEGGLSVGEAAMPATAPESAEQLALFSG